jgi:hypothetical protein
LPRTNIYEDLKDDFRVFESVLDVSCGNFFDLIRVWGKSFQKLIEMDQAFPGGAYCHYQAGKEVLGQPVESILEFKNRYSVITPDLVKFNFKKSI